jgi:hypothetical protein
MLVIDTRSQSMKSIGCQLFKTTYSDLVLKLPLDLALVYSETYFVRGVCVLNHVGRRTMTNEESYGG